VPAPRDLKVTFTIGSSNRAFASSSQQRCENGDWGVDGSSASSSTTLDLTQH
jgi:hypothetical protein